MDHHSHKLSLLGKQNKMLNIIMPSKFVYAQSTTIMLLLIINCWYTLTHFYSLTPNTTVPRIICANLHMRSNLHPLAIIYIVQTFAVMMSTRSTYLYGYIFTCTRWYIAVDNNMEQLITAFRNKSSTLVASEELDIIASDDSIGLLWRLPHYNCRQTSDVYWWTRYCRESRVNFQCVYTFCWLPWYAKTV